MESPSSFRCSPELKLLIHKTARHCHCSVTDVLRYTFNGILHGRAVIQKELEEVYYGTSDVITVRGIRFPDIPPRELRRLIALRCLEELSKNVNYTPAPKVRTVPFDSL